MSETTPTCQIHNKYPGEVLCRNLILTSDPEGLCILHSKNQGKNPEAFREALKSRLAQKDREYDLRGVFFPGPFDLSFFFESRELDKPINFSRAIFVQSASFPGVKFIDAIFHNAIFTDANFHGATFSKKANFILAKFKNADFTQATFEEAAYFLGSIFTEEANFQSAKFKWAFFSDSSLKKANFSHSTFAELGGFSKATFLELADFSQATISGRMVFISINAPALPFRGDFLGLELSKEAMLRFQDMSLAQTRFLGTDLRYIDFRNVIWHSYSNWLFRQAVPWLPIRQAVYDELLLDEKEPSLLDRVKSNLINLALFWKWPYRHIFKPDKGDYAIVEELYRYLRINFEIKGDYKNAGDFHYGEMEMHRRASPWRRWVPVSWYNLYRCLSGYGERPLWALIWLIVFIFGFSGLVWQLGLAVNNYGNWAGLWDSFIYILQKSTLQRPDWPKPYTFGAKFWSSLSVFLIPGQAALFLLALRNRLGRRR